MDAAAILCQWFLGNRSSRVFFLSQCTDSWEQLKFLLFKELNGWKLTHPLKTLPRIILKHWARVFPGTEKFWDWMGCCWKRVQRKSHAWEPVLQDGSVVADSLTFPHGIQPTQIQTHGTEFFQKGLRQELMLLVILAIFSIRLMSMMMQREGNTPEA